MSHTLSVRIEKTLFESISKESRRLGVPVSQIVKKRLMAAPVEAESDPLLKYRGIVKGLPKNIARLKGFNRGEEK